jgi:hypothetical protein
MEPLRCHEPETPVERRASRRVRVTCDAALLTMTTQTAGSLSDISEAGARFEAPDPPGAGATALLRWGAHEAVCTIVWSEGGACGLSFTRPLSDDVVAETAAMNRVLELPIASVGNITQGRKRSMPFLKTAPAEDPPREMRAPDEPSAHAAIGSGSLAQVLARYRRTGSWSR